MDLREKLIKRLGVPNNWDKYHFKAPHYSFNDILEIAEEIVNENFVLDNVIECPTCNNDGREIRYDIGTYPCATCGGKGFR